MTKRFSAQASIIVSGSRVHHIPRPIVKISRGRPSGRRSLQTLSRARLRASQHPRTAPQTQGATPPSGVERGPREKIPCAWAARNRPWRRGSLRPIGREAAGAPSSEHHGAHRVCGGGGGEGGPSEGGLRDARGAKRRADRSDEPVRAAAGQLRRREDAARPRGGGWSDLAPCARSDGDRRHALCAAIGWR